jgi:hypothetical protein
VWVCQVYCFSVWIETDPFCEILYRISRLLGGEGGGGWTRNSLIVRKERIFVWVSFSNFFLSSRNYTQNAMLMQFLILFEMSNVDVCVLVVCWYGAIYMSECYPAVLLILFVRVWASLQASPRACVLSRAYLAFVLWYTTIVGEFCVVSIEMCVNMWCFGCRHLYLSLVT